MEDDPSAKAAPVTRLRRRLSVEPEDSPLPTTPSTPSKKRTTRLAAKPQLELIDEIASENVPKRTTRKTAVKEVESEGTGTPTPVTPSRRSTRVRSNTSLLSETIGQSVESPRAKRALRRNSQLGSDNESAPAAPITPARQTRRTRKDSTTSVDKQATAPDDNITVLTITSTETSTKEKAQKGPKTNKDKADSPSTRKSPRLNNKSENTDETDNIHIEVVVHSTQDKNPVVHSTQDKNPVVLLTPAKGKQLIESKSLIHTGTPKEIHIEIERLSTSSTNLINDMKTSDKNTKSLNESTTSIDKSINDLNNKRNRTKSWTTITASPLNVELTDGKEDMTKKNTRYRSISGSGDGIQNSGSSSKLEELEIKSPNKSINKRKISLLNTSTENKENIVVSEKPLEPSIIDTTNFFESSPINHKPMITIEDSDSGSYDKLVMDVKDVIEGEDQCVPVGNPANQTQRDSIEPMDIDETMPENVTIDDFSDKSNASKDELELPEKSLLNDKSLIKSKRKSSISKQATDTTPRNSISEDDKNKSTLKPPQNITQNSSKNNSRKNSVSFREENIENINESKRKSSVSLTHLETSQSESVKLTVQSPRKSSKSIEDEKVQNQSVNDSKINQNKDESSKTLNQSTRKSSSTLDNTEKLDESVTESQKNVSMSQNYCEIDQVEKSLNKSQRKSSTSIVDNNLEKLYENCNNVSACPNKYEIQLTDGAKNKSINKSRKSSTSIVDDNLEKLYESCNVSGCQNKSDIKLTEEENNKSINKSQRKSSISQINSFVEENNVSKSANKSKRTSSQSKTESPMLEKSGNENKSTLVISQLKDVSTNDSNNVTSPNLTNKLSKSETGPEVKNKAIDKINLSPKNYLTSTPIQQKSLQKMAMQIITSIISPAVENKNVTIEKTPKLNEIKEEIKFKNKNKLSTTQSSSASSDEETVPKSLRKLAVKKSPKTVPALDSSTSESESESERKIINKKITKKVRALDSSSNAESDIVENQQKIAKKTNNKTSEVNKIKTPNKDVPDSDSSDSEEFEEEVSKDKNTMFDDEASEASDDYESGDSRSDEERQYEDDNEILEKGKTLDSEEELSNDSDYERDSFIVSSDAEDNEMLSGTGDDLSMSDNELTMSAKSKKKFNERKLKQQKKASREMYEARHKNDSAASSKADTSKSKKSKRQRLESSTLESENDSEVIKKNNRLRIDSSKDSVNSADDSIKIKKKKSKRLSESVCETTMNENEISLFNQTTEKNDPLTAAIKLEPKTPQKDFNISTVAINDNIEEVQVDSNASIMKHSETLDPLQASMVVDDEDDEDSLSENNEIIENYDSVLNNLNLQTNKLKTHDTSLNLNKKVKSAKNPVIDQLNLTQTKKSEKNKNFKNEQAEPVDSKTKENVVMEDDSSDSIDMKLLFPEESNDSEVNASKFKPEEDNPSEPDTIIPLKRTEAKTNLLDKTDNSISLNESSLGSQKKKKKRKTSQSSQPGIDESMILDNGIKIVVDTIGTHEEVDLSQALTNSSKKNKKNKSPNETAAFEVAADIDCTDGLALTHVETPMTSEKKKKKNKNKSFDESTKAETSINISGSYSDKKSRKKSQSTCDFIETAENREETMVEELPVNTSIKSEKKKKNKDASVIVEPMVETQSAKKKSKKFSISEENKSEATHEETMIEDIPANTSIKSEKKKKNKDASVIAEPVVETQSAKKKSKKISISAENTSLAVHEEPMIEDIPANTSIRSEKKKKNKDASVIAEPVVETQSAKKKSKKISISAENTSLAVHEETIMEVIPVNTSIKSEKKKKNKNASVIAEPAVETQSAKKKSKKISISEENKSQAINDESDDAPEEVSYKRGKESDVTDNVTDATTSTEKKFKKKKKKKNRSLTQSDEKLDKAEAPTEQEDGEQRKRKRKGSNNPTETDGAAKVISTESAPTRNEKKKRKVNLEYYAAAYDNIAQSNEDTSAQKLKKDKSKKHPKEDIPQNNAKKRKNREDDSVEKISKVLKQDSFDEIHVPRLPESILEQLTEKPNKTKKLTSSVISTMPFLVEKGGRKNKPSEYLEQSVYLNDSPVKKKKNTKYTNPKVLPFTPTALTSDNGCTSRFNISLLPKDTQFVAQASNAENFKEAFLGTQRIKKMGTLERCKVQRSHKLSKF